MTVAKAAEALEVSPALVYALLKAGKIAHHRIGLGRGVIRIDAESLAEYKRSCEVPVFETSPAPRVSRGLVIFDYVGQIRRQKRERAERRATKGSRRPNRLLD
jgi:excisionase family DNA binding protein